MDPNDHRFSDRVPYAARVMVIRGAQAWLGEVKDLSEGGCGLFRPAECALDVAEIVQLVRNARLAGIVLAPPMSEQRPLVEALLAAGIKLVRIVSASSDPQDGSPCVYVDDRDAV